MVNRYELALRQEILLERGADILADLMHNDPQSEILFSQVWKAKGNILLAKTLDELVAIEDTFNLASNFLQEQEQRER